MAKIKEEVNTNNNVIEYEKCSNVVKYNNKKLYLNKILWQNGLSYDDIKDFIVSKK